MKYKTVIFDMDGTLADTLEDMRFAINRALRMYGMPERTLDEVRAAVGNGVRVLVARSVPQGEENADFEAVYKEYQTYYEANCLVKTKPYDGICELLSELTQRGYKLAVVSNKPDAAAKRVAEKLFSDTFSAVVGERSGVRRKPAADMVTAALTELSGTRGESVYIGDSEVDIETATNAGIDLISVTWGFRSRELLERLGAEIFADRPEDILSLV